MPLQQISFHCLKPVNQLNHRKRLKEFLVRLFKSEKTSLLQVSIIFCSDKYLLAINKKYLKHNYFTDTISFRLNEPSQPINGEIYISIDRVRQNAEAYQSSVVHELHRVIIHSCLHLCGFEDRTTELKQKMQKKENIWLSVYFKERVPRKTVPK
jgi:probable rRNA maturation factor